MAAPHPKRNIAVLTGNGLSVAFNPELALWKLCRDVMARITSESDNGDAVTKAMKDIAERVEHACADSDFEVLVGAFVALSDTMDRLYSLAADLEPDDEGLRRSLLRSAVFVRTVRDRGISYVLELIADRAFADFGSKFELNRLINAICLAFGGAVSFGNLNYDTLVLSSLTENWQPEFCDMADGRRKGVFHAPNGWDYSVKCMRTSGSSFPGGRRIKLLHLHGSLTFWSNRKEDTYKLDISTVRECGIWEAVRGRSTGLRPEVILANQHDKSQLVKSQPYALAYEMFGTGLEAADHWLIIGYSFRDVCVNELLRTMFKQRVDDPPVVLVVTYGTDPERDTVLDAFGWNEWYDGPADWLTINREGADAMVDSSDWKRFSGQPGTWRLAS